MDLDLAVTESNLLLAARPGRRASAEKREKEKNSETQRQMLPCGKMKRRRLAIAGTAQLNALD